MAFEDDNGGAIDIGEDTGGSGGGDEGGANDEDLESGTGEGAEGAEGDGSDGSDDRRGDDADKDGDRGSDKSDLPRQIRSALRELNTQNPDFAAKFPKLEKQITGALFKGAQIDGLGGVAAVTEALESIEARGGIEGVEQMAADLDAANKFEADLEKGNPAALELWAKESPSGFARAVLPMFEQLGKLNEEKYEQVGSAVVSSILEKFGGFSVISALGQALTNGKLEDASKHFNTLANFLGEIKKLGGLAKQDPHADRSRELDEREQSLETENEKAFKGAVRSDVNTEVTNLMNSQLRAQLITMGVRKVPLGTANRIRGEINRELQRRVNTEASYQRQYEAVMTTRDRARAAKFVVQAATRKLPGVIKDVLRDFNLKGDKRPTGGQRRDNQERSNVIAGRPKTGEVDFSKTDKAGWLSTMHSHGTAWLRNGKQAKW